mgnify:FL=1
MIPAFKELGDPQAPWEVWFLHGILGSGNNWRGMALKLCERDPRWKAVLVDLRNHGDSVGARPPHDLAACADDLWTLAGQRSGPPRMLVGHSFGGKVALTLAEQARALGATGPGGISQLWVLDASPAPWAGQPEQDAEVVAVMQALQAIPLPMASREQLSATLMAQGFSRSLALWMTTNLKREGQGYGWRFDLDACREMIADYFRADLWEVIEHPPAGLRIDLVRAGRNPRWTEAELRRLRELAAEGTIGFHTLQDAGHWVHADDPEGVLGLLLG